jgi:hypothetical protein
VSLYELENDTLNQAELNEIKINERPGVAIINMQMSKVPIISDYDLSR